MEQKTAQIREKLSGLDKGGKTLLRRAAGKMLSEVDGKTMAVFYRLLPLGLPEEPCFFAFCLQCIWKLDTPEQWQKRVPASQSATYLKGQKNEKDAEHFFRQVTRLLDLRWDDDGYLAAKLCRLAKYCASKNVVWDCDDLLCDLLSWNSSSRYVQRKWARALCGTEQKRTDKSEGEKKDAD